MSPVQLAPFPHAGGCAGCRKAGQCSGCGAKLLADRKGKRCKNGRCNECHGRYCTSDRRHCVPAPGFGDAGKGPHVVEVTA